MMRFKLASIINEIKPQVNGSNSIENIYDILKKKYPNYEVYLFGDEEKHVGINVGGVTLTIYWVEMLPNNVFVLKRVRFLKNHFSGKNDRYDSRKIGTSPNIQGILKLLQNRI